MKAITILLFIPIILGITVPVYVANGSSEDEINCYERGIRDGEEHPFNQDTYDDCEDDYYRGFIKGCMSVEGNTREACELATDA
jgi:hypothetical protein